MAIIGFILSFLLLCFASLMFIISVVIGGEEFSAIDLKKNWYWVLPAFILLCYLWGLLFTNIPFEVAIKTVG